MVELYKKLLKVQEEVGAISKSDTNPFFVSKYFDINKLIQHIEPILTKHRLLLIQPIKEGSQYSILIDADSGDSVKSFLELPKLSDPQKLGSAVTYYRRYTLCSLLALQAEDDDANVSSAAFNKTPKIDYNESKLRSCKTLTELQKAYSSMPPEKKIAFTALKDKLKLELK